MVKTSSSWRNSTPVALAVAGLLTAGSLAAINVSHATERPGLRSGLDCEGISDADHRNACRAVAKNDRSYCELIKNKDLRFECRARVR
jgi:hypothetical protein